MMKRNKQKKLTKPDRRELVSNLDSVDISFRDRIRYFGSPYHKYRPTYCGPPRKREKASQSSICPENLHEVASVETIEGWLRTAIQVGAFKQLEERHSFPKYIWYLDGEILYEATGGEWSGVYHGYPINKSEWPEGIEKLIWNV